MLCNEESNFLKFKALFRVVSSWGHISYPTISLSISTFFLFFFYSCAKRPLTAKTPLKIAFARGQNTRQIQQKTPNKPGPKRVNDRANIRRNRVRKFGRNRCISGAGNGWKSTHMGGVFPSLSSEKREQWCVYQKWPGLYLMREKEKKRRGLFFDSAGSLLGQCLDYMTLMMLQ